MNYKILEGDSFEKLGQINTGSIDLVVTSPPYNMGKEYEERNSLTEYISFQEKLIRKIERVLSPCASICWQVGNYVNNGEVFPLDIYFYPIFNRLGFHLRNRIVWHFDHGLHCSKRFSGRYETLLWFSKGDDYTFNLDPVRVPSKYPGKRHYKGEKIGQPSGNPLGKNPSDLWRFLSDEWDCGLWDVPNVKANHPEKTDHPCQFPVEVAERCVLALSNPGDTILDPYMGVGSTLIAALKHDRVAIGIDQDERYIQIAHQRIAQLSDGTIKLRPLGKPVHQPSGKLSQRPSEWGKEVKEPSIQ